MQRSALISRRSVNVREMAEVGPVTGDGHERWPACRVGLTGNTGMKDFNRAMLDFFGHPGEARGTTAKIGEWALDCFLSCEVRLLVDDLHFLRWRNRSATEISNHFKYIANEFPVTLVKNDAAAEAARAQLVSSLAGGRLTSRPRPATRRAARRGGA
jgi:hypothetical protein